MSWKFHLFCVTVHTSETILILPLWLFNELNIPSCINQLQLPPPPDVFVDIHLYCHLSIYYLPIFFTGNSCNHGAVRPCVSCDATCRQAQTGIYQCHPHKWEALYRDMSAPCLLVVLMKLGVGRVGSLVQVPGFPSNESASPHSNRLLPWELRLGLPSTVLKYRLISTHTCSHTYSYCKESSTRH